MNPRIPLPEGFGDQPFLVVEARDGGIGRSRLNGGDLWAPFWGIRSPVEVDGSVENLCRAVSLRLPPDAFFMLGTAAQLLRLPLPYRLQPTLPLHVGFPAPTRAMDARNIVGHSVRMGAGDLIVEQGLNITGPGRIWLDLAAKLSLLELVALGDYLVQWEHPLTTIDQLKVAAARNLGRRGMKTARLALPLIRTRAESPRESALRVIIVLAGLPEPECNYEIFDDHGRFLARADLAYPRYKLLLEYQGDQHRTDRAQWRKDIRRVGSVEDIGWQMLQFTDDDLQRPTELTMRVERRLRARGWTGVREYAP